MDKIINTKEKFYLLKKHMRKDDYESLIKDSNKSLLNILQIKKSQNNEDNKTINNHLEKQKDLLFYFSLFKYNKFVLLISNFFICFFSRFPFFLFI